MAKDKKAEAPGKEPVDNPGASQQELETRVKELESAARDNKLRSEKLAYLLSQYMPEGLDADSEIPFVVGLSLGEDGEVTGDAQYRKPPSAYNASASEAAAEKAEGGGSRVSPTAPPAPASAERSRSSFVPPRPTPEEISAILARARAENMGQATAQNLSNQE